MYDTACGIQNEVINDLDDLESFKRDLDSLIETLGNIMGRYASLYQKYTRGL